MRRYFEWVAKARIEMLRMRLEGVWRFVLVSRSSWASLLFPTVSTIYRSARIGFEWNIAFITAISADCLIRLSWFSSVRHLDCTSVESKELDSSGNLILGVRKMS